VSARGWAIDTRSRTAAIPALYVHPSHQGCGLGRQLLQATAAHLVQFGFTTLQIECLAANAPARAFYERMGGRVIGERLFDEEGFLLPEVIYEWADIAVLVPH
jgi:ribosomal protein S18 acetylase RimI-like enzyme